MNRLLSIGLLNVGLCCYAAHAATVYRCEDANGQLSFSANGCTADSQTSLQRVENARPGGKRPVLMAKPSLRPSNKQVREPTVVAAKADGCGDLLTASERRQAIIRGQVRQGMNRADVENALGQPRHISQFDNLTRYRYETRSKQQRAREITFDEYGCVRHRR